MSDRTYRLQAIGDEHTIDYSFLVGFHADPLEAIRSDGNQAPDDAHAASFTFNDPDEDDDGQIYLPLDPSLAVIVHEAAHALVGLYHRRRLTIPTRDSDPDQEEAFVHTLGVLVEEIVNALYDQESGDGVG